MLFEHFLVFARDVFTFFQDEKGAKYEEVRILHRVRFPRQRAVDI